jgi:tetratricopeptide (TPR) repeat protein
MAANLELAKALELHRKGRLAEAESAYRTLLDSQPGNPGALHLLGMVKVQTGEYQEAVRLIGDSIESGGPNPARLNDLASALRAAGEPEAAMNRYREALALRGDLVPAWLGLGALLQEGGRAADAVGVLEEAVRSLPGEERLTFALATLLAESARFDEAEHRLTAVLKTSPQSVQTRRMLSDVLVRLERREEAEDVLLRGLEATPHDADLMASLGLLLLESGRLKEAERILRAALEVRPGHVDAWFALGKTLIAADRIDADFLYRWISIDGPLPGIVRQAAIEHVLALPDFELVSRQLDSDATDLLVEDASMRLMQSKVLIALLRKDRIDNMALEQVLAGLRHACLLTMARQKSSVDLPFLVALAHQCFHNEYVYSLDAGEAELLERELHNRDPQTLSVQEAALIAAYEPLYRMDPERIRIIRDKLTGEALSRELIREQIEEPMEERALASGISSITAIEHAISLAVREQYEDNPYPRWGPVGRLVTRPIASVLTGLFPFLSGCDRRWPDAPEILVAGCGTGHQSVATAQRFQRCRVTAIDLSLSSLAFAQRKTREAGIGNIEYLQGDILEIGPWDKRFDLIESTGVLHHLSEPLAGWQALRRLLRPGGFMKIGLYSELGRRSIVAARELIAQQGLVSTPGGMRDARRLIMSLPHSHPARQVIERPDFYTMSTCRDLLFHVQEHRLTLPEIGAMLKQLKLEFLGFELPSNEIARSYRSAYPGDPDMRSLDNWQRFEQEHEGTFSRMYLFWASAPEE